MSASTFIQTPVEPALLAGFWVFSRQNNLSPSVSLRLVAHHVISQAGFTVDDYDPGSERRGDFENWARRRRKALQANGIHPVLIVRVTPGFKDAFARYAGSRDESCPVALKAIVRHVVARANIEPHDLQVPKTLEPRSERVTARFSKPEMAELERRAHDFGGVRQWLIALARSQIAPGAPQFTKDALRMLYESNRELAALGRNVNQIAHALNLDLQQSGQLRGSARLVEDLVSLRQQIAVHVKHVTVLCRKSATRWSQL